MNRELAASCLRQIALTSQGRYTWSFVARQVPDIRMAGLQLVGLLSVDYKPWWSKHVQKKIYCEPFFEENCLFSLSLLEMVCNYELHLQIVTQLRTFGRLTLKDRESFIKWKCLNLASPLFKKKVTCCYLFILLDYCPKKFRRDRMLSYFL